MPGRGGRIGGGSRGGGLRAPRVSSGGSRGARVNIGSRAPRVASSAPSANAATSQPVRHHRSWYGNRLPGVAGGLSLINIIIAALIALGFCACVVLAFVLQNGS
jgi:hypothetical protein